MKKKFQTISQIVLVSLTVIFAISILISKQKIGGQNQIYSVMSGSMSPTIRTGSLIVIRPSDTYQVGDIVTYITENRQENRTSRDTVTHRIIKTGDHAFLTQGDANDAEDPFPITQEQIIGKVIFSLPLLGYPISFSKTPTGFVTLLILPALIIIGMEIRNIILTFKKPTKSKNNRSKELIIGTILLIFASFGLTQAYFQKRTILTNNQFATKSPPILLNFYFREDNNAVGFRIYGGNLSQFENLHYSIVYTTSSGSAGAEGDTSISHQSDITIENLILGSCSTGGNCTYDSRTGPVHLEITLTNPSTFTLTSEIN